MALIDVDRHILMEISVLQDKLRNAAIDFRQQWEIISQVRDQTELLVIRIGVKKDDPELQRLRDKIFRAMKVCNTKMIVMDDCMSRQNALLKHLVSEVVKSDTGKGRET
jgi:hypothetical protein